MPTVELLREGDGSFEVDEPVESSVVNFGECVARLTAG